MISKRWSVVAALAVVLPLAACGGDDSSSEATEAPATSAAETTAAPEPGLSGSIFVSGSSTVEPITTAVAKLFGEANPDVAEKLRGGDMKPIGVIVGYVMKETRGRADGGEVTALVRSELGLD